MMEHTLGFLSAAEDIARKTANAEQTLAELRKLSLDEFGQLLISLPHPSYPAISAVLPKMASPEIQKSWTGASGTDLLKQTLAFVRILENNVVRHMGRTLHDASILDFGCGYGRILRMMYYYTNPDKIWGIDAWEKSLATCREAKILGHLAQSDRQPERLPVQDTTFDVAFSFSVFTHLEPTTAKLCLSAVRRSMNTGGLFIATIRPIEFWPFIDKQRNQNNSARLMKDHRANGVAYLPHGGEEGKTYGDTSLTFAFFAQPGWEVLGYDRSIFDAFQVSVILRAV